MLAKGLTVVIVGPTASGKTALAVQLAKELGTEVISADGRQFYHEMQIGTARPLKGELEGVTHHFLGHKSIQENYGAGQYADEARPVLEGILSKYGVAIVVGGSGLYIKALLEGLDELPEVSVELREQIKLDYKTKGLEWLQGEVRERDLVTYESMDFQNPARLMRTLELLMVSGKTLAELYRKPENAPSYKTVFIGCDWSREVLYERINKRTAQMIEVGLVKEVEGLFPFRNLNALQTVGYTEVFQYLDGNISLAEAEALIAQHTRNYAKRQMTWFKNQTDAVWMSPEDVESILNYVRRFQG